MVLNPDFFNRPTLEVAQDLLGAFLVRDGLAFMVTEVEAYDGPEDKANHAYKGLTTRTAVMFGPPGVFYVYLIYGSYWMLNVVTGAEGYPAAVLIRGTAEVMGPGRLTRALGIDNSFNQKVALPETGLWFEDRGAIKGRIIQSPRIGVAYAGPIWSKKPYRFNLPPEKKLIAV